MVHYIGSGKQEATMSEHRKGERRKVMAFTPVYDIHGNVLLGYLGDLTLLGAMMVSERPLEIERNITLAIEFRESSEIPSTRMTIPARVAWCRQEEHLTYYNTGFEFLEMTAGNKRVIESILERFRFRRDIPA